MAEVVRKSSSQLLWDQLPDPIDWNGSLDGIDEESRSKEVLAKGTKAGGEEGEEAEQDVEEQYDGYIARLSQAKHLGVRSYSQEYDDIDIDPEDDISGLIAVYDEGSSAPTQPIPPLATNTTFNSEDTVVVPTTPEYGGLGKRDTSTSTCIDPRPLKNARFDSPDGQSKPSGPSIDTPYYITRHPLNKWTLPIGVLWEIDRLMASGKITEDNLKSECLSKLQSLGNNAKAAPVVEKVLTGKDAGEELVKDSNRSDPFAKERSTKFPYDELDKEEEQFREGRDFGCLGFNEDSDWYGGKVHLRARIKNVASKYSKDPDFRVLLDRAELGPSFRFSRRFGSASFVRMKIPKVLWGPTFIEPLMSFLLRPFVFCGNIYRAFYEKDKTVFLFRTNELSVGNSISSTRAVPGRLSLADFLEFHNPLGLNSKQTVAKWASRFALGLSTSAPGLKLKVENIHEIEDIISVGGEDMTDGSGFINQAALRLLQNKFKWDEWPTAIQCRVAGAKGMLLQHPDNGNHEPEVWIRPSQTKIRYSNNGEDECRLIIDVLRSCHSRSSCVLGTETIINMAENGVPAKQFFKLLDEGFDRLITSLTTWEGEDAMYNLWATVARLGGVRAARVARAQAGLARVLGYSESDAQDDEDEDGLDEEESEESSVAWWGDEISGQPSSLEETVMRLLDAGFDPYTCSVLREKLSAIVTTHIQNYGAKYRIEVPMSCMTFIQPDPLGVLEEGQIFYKSAHRNLPTVDGHFTDTIIGPVLVTRHPCKLPTDVQRWDAVDCPQLRDQTGIIFFSIKGRRRAADYLGGGDYDGDKALLIHDPSLVNPFVNADICFADPRNDIEEKCFVKGTKKLLELVVEHAPTKENPLACIRALQGFLLGGLRNISRVGQYSNMHDYCTVTKGLTHEDTIRMAHMFCRTLDGAKTGLMVKEDVFAADKKSYNRGVMKWKKPAIKSSMKSQYVSDDGGMKVERPEHLGPFIMDSLVKYSLHRAATFERQFKERMLKHKKHIIDEHLVGPWRKAEKHAQQRKEKGCPLDMQVLDEIRNHVKKMYEKHREQVKKMRPKGNGGHFTDLPIEVRQNQLRDLSKEFASYPNPDDLMLDEDTISRLRASYAYLHDCEANKYTDKGWTRFPWDVAMSELCLIKGKAIGGSKTVAAGYYDRFFLSKTRQ